MDGGIAWSNCCSPVRPEKQKTEVYPQTLLWTLACFIVELCSACSRLYNSCFSLTETEPTANMSMQPIVWSKVDVGFTSTTGSQISGQTALSVWPQRGAEAQHSCSLAEQGVHISPKQKRSLPYRLLSRVHWYERSSGRTLTEETEPRVIWR